MIDLWKISGSTLGSASSSGGRTSVMGSAVSKSGIGSSLSGKANSPNAIYQAPRAVRKPANAPTPNIAKVGKPASLQRTVKVPGPMKMKISNAAIGRAFIRGVRGAITAPIRALPFKAKAGLGLAAGAAGIAGAGKATSKHFGAASRSRAIQSPQAIKRNQLHRTFWGT